MAQVGEHRINILSNMCFRKTKLFMIDSIHDYHTISKKTADVLNLYVYDYSIGVPDDDSCI